MAEITNYLKGQVGQEQTKNIYLYVLIGYVFVAIGRTPEIIHVLLPLRLGMIFSVLIIVVFIQSLFNGKLMECYQSFTEAKLFVWLFITACISVIFSSYHMLSLSFVFTVLIKLVMFYFMIVITVNSMRDANHVVWGYIISVLILGIPSLFNSSGVRFSSLDKTYDPNDIALLMAVTLPMVIYFIPQNHGVKKICLYFTTIVIVTSIVVSGSRGGFLGVAAVILVMLLRSRYSIVKKASVVVIITSLFLYAAPETYRQRIFSMVDDDQEYNLTDKFGRKQIWERSIILFKNNPIFGVGPGCFQVANGFTFTEDVGGVAWRATAHNSFVLIGTEMGSAGLFLYVSALIVSIVNMRKVSTGSEPEADSDNSLWLGKALEASIVGFMVSGFFLSSCYSPISFFLVGMATVHSKLNSKKIKYHDLISQQ